MLPSATLTSLVSAGSAFHRRVRRNYDDNFGGVPSHYFATKRGDGFPGRHCRPWDEMFSILTGNPANIPPLLLPG